MKRFLLKRFLGKFHDVSPRTADLQKDSPSLIFLAKQGLEGIGSLSCWVVELVVG